MKTIKSTFFPFLVLFIAGSLLTSCSKEDETKQSISENTKVSSFLKSFYSKNFEFGKSINSEIIKESSTLSKSVEVEDVVITEVLVGEDTRARGYIITSKSTNTFVYFVDIDRIDYKMTAVDIKINETKVINNIDEFDKYVATNEFDIIKVTQEYIEEQNSIDEKRPFWGWAYMQGPCGEAGEGMAYVYHNHYICGIRDQHIQQYSLVDANQPLIEPCGFRP
jgi:hypothetical protein